MYKYIANTREGKIVQGTIGVNTEDLAEEALRNAGYDVLSLRAVKPKQSLEELFPAVLGVKRRDVVDFSRQLATLVESGIPLPNALSLLKEQTMKPFFKKVICGLYEEIQGGSSFGAALGKYPKIFPEIYRRIVAAGEKTGNMESALRQAVKHMERGVSAAQKARRAVIYPLILIVLGIGVVTLLLTVAMPPLLDMFEELEVSLPWTTRLLKSVTDFLSAFKFQLLMAVLALGSLLVWYFSRPEGRLLLDRLILRIPLARSIVLQSNLAVFSRTTAALLQAGVPLPQVMSIVHETSSNRVIGRAIGEVREGILQGQGISRPMAMNGIFPPLLVQVVMVGEQTGTLDSNLESIATFYEDEVDRRIDIMISLIEPAIITGMGILVGFIALAVIMPMYSLYKHIGQ